MKLKLIALSLLLLAVPSVCFAGPFGFEAGMSRKEIIDKLGAGAVVSQVGDSVTFNTAPTKSAYFSEYLCIFDQNNQLDSVTATSKPLKTKQAGEDLRDEFERLKSALAEKYGVPLYTAGSPASGTKWEERIGQDFTNAVWDGGSPQAKTSHIEKIILSIQVGTAEYGIFELVYYFDNWKSAL
jgi:hypothetical protein